MALPFNLNTSTSPRAKGEKVEYIWYDDAHYFEVVND